MSETNPRKRLESFHQQATQQYRQDEGQEFLENISSKYFENLKIVVENADTQKAVNTVLLTSVLKKCLDPDQDVRKHQKKMDDGYSGRTLDFNNVTPFMKDNFPRFAMGEAGWLTRSLEQPEPYNMDYPGEIRNKEVKNAFLQAMAELEKGSVNPENALTAHLLLLERKSSVKQADLAEIEAEERLTISLIHDSVKRHIEADYSKGGRSRIPVIAIYTVYQVVKEDVRRYDGKELLELGSHTTPDTQSSTIGDIEVLDEQDYFEAVEIKHEKTTTYYRLVNAENKIRNSNVDRYYFLTTADKQLGSQKQKIDEFIHKMSSEEDCEIIVDGVLPTLKYYLRLADQPSKFVEKYTENLQQDYERNTDLKGQHIEKWNDIIRELPEKLE
ncbi:restriction endonuclease, SacI family [Candidatus Nanohalococcus occultus]|uniref:Integrase/Recombinase n=1 Tax=Candidatus Nanohalococcus occultus TaxID=2978047 RepID=A0ABY8CEY7_9ARCH|nr:integrase/Recombinase [Candidatus Nanohaloarchaeota archaeon SVXNc]